MNENTTDDETGEQPTDTGRDDNIVGMPPHKYDQAKERARDDLTRQELTNMVYDLPCVCELLVDGEEELRPTEITIGFSEAYGAGIDDVITIMQRAGWKVDSVTFGSYQRLTFAER